MIRLTIPIGDSVQWTGHNAFEIWGFIGRPELIDNMELHSTDTPAIPTVNGNEYPEVGDRITKIAEGIFEISKSEG
jgi:hypothetical protein